MDRQKLQELGRAGGKKAHAMGKAHRYTSEEAKAAGRKGGLKTSANRAHMKEIGSKGGKAEVTSPGEPKAKKGLFEQLGFGFSPRRRAKKNTKKSAKKSVKKTPKRSSKTPVKRKEKRRSVTARK